MSVINVRQDVLASKFEELKDRKAKISALANRKYEDRFKGESTTKVIIRRASNFELNQGLATDAGRDIPETNITHQSESYELTQLNDLKIGIEDVDKIIEDYNIEGTLVDRAAYTSAMNHDCFVASLAAQNGIYLNNQNPTTYTKDTVESLYSDLQTRLHLGDVEEENQFALIPPKILGLTQQAPMRTGYDLSAKYKEVFNIGVLYALNVGYSNNLPVKYTMTIGAVVTEDDTIKIQVPNVKKISEGISPAYDEVTLTAKAAPSNPGEFDVAASAAAQQQIIQDIINGTGTPGPTSYIELSAADRAIVRRAYANCETFGAVNTNKAGITLRAGSTIEVSFTSGSNTLSAKSTLVIALDPKAIHFGETMKNFKIVGTEYNQDSFRSFVMWENIFGGKVTTENKARIAIAEVIV